MSAYQGFWSAGRNPMPHSDETRKGTRDFNGCRPPHNNFVALVKGNREGVMLWRVQRGTNALASQKAEVRLNGCSVLRAMFAL